MTEPNINQQVVSIENVRKKLRELDEYFKLHKWSNGEVISVYTGLMISQIESFPEEHRERALFDTINPIMEHFGYDTIKE